VSAFYSQLGRAFRGWWRDRVREKGLAGAGILLVRELWEFVRDSTPERRRQRYGDMEYDWEHRVNTTSGTVGWRERLLGVFLSAYQPTEPPAFREMMASLPIDFREFTFVDLGSGKGRTLLMAAEYPFHRILGVEILPELHRVAEENVRACQKSLVETQQAASLLQSGSRIECICADALEYDFPAEPLVLYLFNPVSESDMARVLGNLERSLREHSRRVYILYHNPLLEHLLAGGRTFKRTAGKDQFALYSNLG
jgi:SAM-dependent methyltransferase